MDFSHFFYVFYLIHKLRNPDFDYGSSRDELRSGSEGRLKNGPFGPAKDRLFNINVNINSGRDIPYRHHARHDTAGTTGVPISDFIPFGSGEGDNELDRVDDMFVERSLTGEPFLFFNSSYQKLYLNTNGGVSFGEGVRTWTPVCETLRIPMIVPFWADIDTRNGGEVYYRQTTSESVLKKVETLLKKAFPSTGTSNLKPVWSYVITWDKVAFFGAGGPSASCPGKDLRNTFQAILIRTATQSYVIFLYNEIMWTTGTSASGSSCTGLGGHAPAKAGFDYGDRETLFNLPNSCTHNVRQIADMSNIEEPGKWAFRVTNNVEERNCEIECGTDDEYLVDPFDCSYYYHCSAGHPVRRPCPPMAGGGHLVFDPSQNTCVWPQDYKCEPIC